MICNVLCLYVIQLYLTLPVCSSLVKYTFGIWHYEAPAVEMGPYHGGRSMVFGDLNIT